MRRRIRGLAIAAVATFTLLAGCGGTASSASTTISIRFSQFEQERLTAVAGVPITITLRNDDPIAHEWMVGDDAMHQRHRAGTESSHTTVPTEVTIPALSTRVTTIVFDQPGTYRYVCHLPGHEAYGMTGTLHVVAP